jgi:hypothetical protein
MPHVPHEKQILASSQEVEPRKQATRLNRLARNSKRLAAASLAVVVASGEAAPSVNAKTPSRPVPVLKAEGKMPKHLLKIDQLPGYGKKVSPELRQKLENSVVQVVIGPKPDLAAGEQSSFWSENCTGIKIAVPSDPNPYVLTAGHCADEATGVANGVFNDPFAPQDKAENFVGVGLFQFAIESPKYTPGEEYFSSLGVADGLSVSTDGQTDAALLHIVPSLSGGSQSYDEIPSLSAEHFIGPKPEPGMQIALYGMPEADGDTPIVGTGHYIGRVNYSYGQQLGANSWTGREIDIVAINPQTPAADNCNFGTSGSVGVYANGTFTGPLSVRFNIGYGPNRQILQPEDQSKAPYVESAYENIEAQTGVKLSRNSVICGYSVMQRDTITIPNLVAGLGTPPPAAEVNAITIAQTSVGTK